MTVGKTLAAAGTTEEGLVSKPRRECRVGE